MGPFDSLEGVVGCFDDEAAGRVELGAAFGVELLEFVDDGECSSSSRFDASSVTH